MSLSLQYWRKSRFVIGQEKAAFFDQSQTGHCVQQKIANVSNKSNDKFVFERVVFAGWEEGARKTMNTSNQDRCASRGQ